MWAATDTDLAEAREALAFWQRRLARLPWYRRSARAEAREMAARWRRRLVVAELDRWRLGALAGPLVWLTDAWSARGRLRLLRASTVGRALTVIAISMTVCAAAMVTLVVVVVAALVS